MTARASLPAHLAERTHVVQAGSRASPGEFILYWMHHAVRAHENPALDAALHAASASKRPLVVYQGLGGRHPHNSDRHHTFIMQGAREVQRELAERGIRHAFHLARRTDAPGPLKPLSERAALVVTEDFPAPPFPRWTERLAAHTQTEVWAVDCACVVPMRSVGRAYERAYEFRAAIRHELGARIERPWPELSVEVGRYDGALGFEPVDLLAADIAELCASCDIDHATGPVPETPGGSTSGYARWEGFKATGLATYHKLRNDPTVAPPRGVSRLSPYLHHGHVSPFRIARETAARRSAGAEKFLDELLIWRELAHNFCLYSENVSTLEALPAWARETLDVHRSDRRTAEYSWERLARAQSGDPLWDLAQHSLLAHGELHNNVRMTWAKAFLEWTSSPERALRLMIDLNHRYALDGSDPNSYAGLLYALGLFDRPFRPERPVIGTLRPRPTSHHAQRLDMAAYRSRVRRATRRRPLSVAVLGAGLSGLMTARVLRDHDWPVRVFERSRRPGGRAQARRRGSWVFDHGAQYFTVRDERTRRYLSSWRQEGVVARWPGRIVEVAEGRIVDAGEAQERYVGAPDMSALAEHLAASVDPVHQRRVVALQRTESVWTVYAENDELGRYDGIVLAMTPEQALPLLRDAPAVARALTPLRSQPCWSVMAAFDEPLPTDFDAAFVRGSALAWVARDSSKPGRGDGERWVLHATADWSRQHIEDEDEAVAPYLYESFLRACGLREQVPVHLSAHRWRYARVVEPLGQGCVWSAELRLAVCGDWCVSPRIEGALLSGMAAAGRMLALPDEPDRAP